MTPSRNASLVLSTLLGALCLQGSVAAADAAAPPVLVELFTSEGCSSCPPADVLLASLQAHTGGAQVIALSEHVDYWDHDGWRDPFSSTASTQRQSAYSDRFGLGSVYTPQMIVDGQYQFVGSDRNAANRAIATAVSKEKVRIQIDSAEWTGDTLTAQVQVGPAPASLRNAKLYAALADASDTSQVGGGENGGRTLTHVSVLRVLKPVGELSSHAAGDSSSVTLTMPGHKQHGQVRMVIFAQQPNFGPIVGVASILR